MSPAATLQKLFITFFTPGLVEELVFRALLLRLPSTNSNSPALTSLLKEEYLEEGDCGRMVSTSASTPMTASGGTVLSSPCSRQKFSSWGSFESSLYEPLFLLNCEAGRAAPGAISNTGRANGPSPTAAATTGGAGASKLTGRPPLAEQVAALAVFVLYHLDIMHACTPNLEFVFDDVRFLALAAILGLSCQEAFIRTGSVWPSVFLHWLWVWCWLTFFFNG